MDLAKLIVSSDSFEVLKMQINAEFKKEAETKALEAQVAKAMEEPKKRKVVKK